MPQFLEPYSLIITIGLFVSATIVIAYLIVRKETKKTSVGNPIFSNLVIHFSHKDDSPDTEKPSLPRYVSYKTDAYWINDEIELHVRQHEIARWYSYDGEKKLRKSLDAQGIHINDGDPQSFEDLGLWHKPNGDLMRAHSIMDRDVLNRLAELRTNGKLKNFELAVIYPWYCFTRKSTNKKYPSDKAVIIDHSSNPKIARPASKEWIELHHKQLLHSQIYRKIIPFISLKWWCKIYGYKFDRTPFDMSELLSL
jgi:hypothetical protein